MPDTVRAALEIVYRFAAPVLRQSLRCGFRDVGEGMIDDVISDVFERLMRRGGPAGSERIDNPAAWLTTVAFNAMRDALRREKGSSWVELPHDLTAGHVEPRDLTKAGLPPDVEECLKLLSQLEQSVVQLKYMGFRSEEAARMLDTTANTVDVTHHKAKRALRLCLGTPT